MSLGARIEIRLSIPGAELEQSGPLWVFLEIIERLFGGLGRIAKEPARANLEHDGDDEGNAERATVALRHLGLLRVQTEHLQLVGGDIAAVDADGA